MERNEVTVTPESMAKIKIAIQDEIPLTITTYTLPHKTEDYMNLILATFLQELHQTRLIEYLKYCLSELLTNSKKANTKRIYFREKHLNIFDKDDYEVGMQHFKAETLDNIEHYLRLQKEAGLYVRLLMQVRNNKIKIEVRNNAEMTFEEYKRVHDKMNRAQQYTSMEQAFASVLDDTEGGGLGLIIMILMLQKVGLTEENFQIICERGETITRIILPLEVQENLEVVKLSQEFLDKVEELPPLPEMLKKVNKMLADARSSKEDLLALLATDSMLSTMMIREVNYVLPVYCDNLEQAVTLLGMRGLKKLLFVIGSIGTLVPIVKKIRAGLPEHSHRVGMYAGLLAREFYAGDEDFAEDAYACGILHDIGKFVFDAVHPDLLDNAAIITKKRGFSTDVFERMTSGVTHSDLGAMIAEHWNCSKTMIAVIKHHHEPDLAPTYARKIACLVYLADFLSHFVLGETEAHMLDAEIGKRFAITDEAALKAMSDRLNTVYERVTKRVEGQA